MPLPKAPTKPATLLTSIPAEPAREMPLAERPHHAVVPLTPAMRAPQPPQPLPTRPSPAARLAVVESKPQPKSPKRPRSTGAPTLFVLDTNVLMHDPTSLFRFEEHDVFLPMVTLEELDNHKKGMSEVARNARQVIRTLDALVAARKTTIDEGIPLDRARQQGRRGPLFLQTEGDRRHAARQPARRQGRQPDHRCRMRAAGRNRSATSSWCRKDINMRIKARALGLPAEDYFNDKVLEDTDLLYTGVLQLPAGLLGQARQGHGVVAARRLHLLPRQRAARRATCSSTSSCIWKNGEAVSCAGEGNQRQDRGAADALSDYTHQRNNVWGVIARNREQNFALNLLMNPESTSSRCSGRRAPARRCSRSRRGSCRRSRTSATPRSS